MVKAVEGDINDVSGSQDGAALMDNKVTWLGGDSGSLFFLKEKRSHLLITTFGMLCMNHLLVVTIHLSFACSRQPPN